jgi:hypothetical protein
MASPFGIEFYAPIGNFKILHEFGEGKFKIEPPNAHLLFSEYVVQSSKEHGIVWIKGISSEINNDSFGISIRSLVDRIAEQLSSRYGAGSKIDNLLSGSIWNDPQYWMNSLESNERSYHYTWSRSRNKQLLDDIESIYVGATAYNSQSSTAVIEYSSLKLPEAQKAIEREMSLLL